MTRSTRFYLHKSYYLICSELLQLSQIRLCPNTIKSITCQILQVPPTSNSSSSQSSLQRLACLVRDRLFEKYSVSGLLTCPSDRGVLESEAEKSLQRYTKSRWLRYFSPSMTCTGDAGIVKKVDWASIPSRVRHDIGLFLLADSIAVIIFCICAEIAAKNVYYKQTTWYKLWDLQDRRASRASG